MSAAAGSGPGRAVPVFISASDPVAGACSAGLVIASGPRPQFARDHEIALLPFGARIAPAGVTAARSRQSAPGGSSARGPLRVSRAGCRRGVPAGLGRPEPTRGPGVASLNFFWDSRRVGAYYFYILDEEFGPAFIRVCAYGPWSAKVWVDGRSRPNARPRRPASRSKCLVERFASCDQPEPLQAICDAFGSERVQAFFDRWMPHVPTPLTIEDRAAGYWWELSMRQVATSARSCSTTAPRPQLLRSAHSGQHRDRPARRGLDGLRPSIRRPTQHRYQTRIFTTGAVRIDFRYKHSRVKQYPRRPRAPDRDGHQPPRRLRRQTPPAASPRTDRQSPRRQPAAAYDRTGRPELCHRLCALSASTSPTTMRAKDRSVALRRRTSDGPGRRTVHRPRRGHRLHEQEPSPTRRRTARPALHPEQDCYDLRRLRLHGLIERIPRKNTYTLTPDGIRVAVFYTKLRNRLLRPLLEADDPPGRGRDPPSTQNPRARRRRLHPNRPARTGKIGVVTTSRLSTPKSNVGVHVGSG